MQVQKDKDIQKSKLVSKENICYVCRRTEAEVQEFFIPHSSEITERYDSEIANIESMLQDKKDSLKSYLDTILKSTENANLDFKIETVQNDLDSFKKIIPRVEDMIKVYAKDERFVGGEIKHHLNYRDFDWKTLWDVRRMILGLRMEIEDDQIYEKNRKQNLERNTEYDSYSDGGYHRIIYEDHVRRLEIGNEEIEKMLENLEKLHEEKDTHLRSMNYNQQTITELKHHKVSRDILSPRYDIDKPKAAVYERVSNYQDSLEHPELYKIPITVPICVICYTLVWHESPLNLKGYETKKGSNY